MMTDYGCINVIDNIIVYASDSFLQLLGFENQEIIGKDINQVFNGLLRANFDILNINQNQNSHYIFTKNLNAIEVSINPNYSESQCTFQIKAKMLNDFFDIDFKCLFEQKDIGYAKFSAPDFILLSGNDTFISFFIPFYNRRENCIGRPLKEYVKEYMELVYTEQFNKLLNGETQIFNELTTSNEDRVSYWDIKVIPVNQENKIKYFLVQASNVTERVKNRKKISEQTETLKRYLDQFYYITENMVDGLLFIDSNGYVKYVNSRAKEMLRVDINPNDNIDFLFEKTKSYKFYDEFERQIKPSDMPISKLYRDEVVNNFIVKFIFENEYKWFSFNGVKVEEDSENQKYSLILNIRDITENYKHRLEVKERKDQLESIIQNVTDGLFIFDNNHKITFLNNEGLKFSNQMIKSNHDDNLQKSSPHFDVNGNHIPYQNMPSIRVLNGEIIKDDFMTVINDGRSYHFSISGCPLYDAYGNVKSALIRTHDITNLIESKRELEEKNQQLQTILDNISDAILFINKKNEVIGYNKVAEEFYNYSTYKDDVLNDLLIKTDFKGKVIPKNECPRLRIINGEKIKNFEMKLKLSNKRKLYFFVSGTPVYDKNNQFLYGVVSYHNITELINNKKEIEFQKTQLNTIIENLNNAVYVIDKDGNYQLMNEAFHNSFPFSNKKNINEDYYLAKFYDYNGRELAFEDMPHSLILKGNPVKDLYRKVVFKNKEYYFSSSGKPVFDQKGNFLMGIIVSNDITDIVNKTQQLEQASKYKSQFLAHMSHEIRTPLNGIIGYLDILSRTNINEEQEDCINKATLASKMLLRIINDILDFSKIEAGKMKLEEIPFNFKNIIEESINVVSPLAYEKSLILLRTIERDIPENLIGDPIRIKQILVNILNNAVKFTKKGYIDLLAVLEKEEKDKVRIKISIKDTGCGIEPSKLSKLFEPFNQTDAAFYRFYGGTGLGLAISKQLVELMNGNIAVQSTINNGSTFFFSIELKKDLDNLKATEDLNKVFNLEQYENLNQYNILLVEDYELNQMVALKMLEFEHINVDLASNGAEAVKMVENNQYDLIFMDCLMPIMDGYRATEEIRAMNNDNCKIPIIAMTAYSLQSDLDRCLKAGMNDYVTKPFMRLDIVRILNKYLPKKNFLTSSNLDNIEESSKMMIEELDFTKETAEKLTLNFSSLLNEKLLEINRFLDEKKLNDVLFIIHGLIGMSANLRLKKLNNLLLIFEKEITEKNKNYFNTLKKLKIYSQEFLHLINIK